MAAKFSIQALALMGIAVGSIHATAGEFKAMCNKGAENSNVAEQEFQQSTPNQPVQVIQPNSTKTTSVRDLARTMNATFGKAETKRIMAQARRDFRRANPQMSRAQFEAAFKQQKLNIAKLALMNKFGSSQCVPNGAELTCSNGSSSVTLPASIASSVNNRFSTATVNSSPSSVSYDQYLAANANVGVIAPPANRTIRNPANTGTSTGISLLGSSGGAGGSSSMGGSNNNVITPGLSNVSGGGPGGISTSYDPAAASR